MKNVKWNFGQIEDDCKISIIPSMPELYYQAMNSRECKREMYERAINAALENLFLWERAARADGFVVDTVMGVHNGDAHPVFSKDGRHVTFVKAYGAIVKDMQEEKKMTPEDLAETVTGKKDIREAVNTCQKSNLMRIADLNISGHIEFEGKNYRYWEFEVDGNVVKVAELALEKALLPDYPKTKYKNLTAEALDNQISYYAMDDESVEDIKAVISGEG